MNNPKTVEDFHNLVHSMAHRERFVFKASPGVDRKYNTDVFVEVYFAKLKQSENSNVSITLVDKEGTVLVDPAKNKQAKLNRILKKFDMEYANKVYPTINPEFAEKEKLQKKEEVLEEVEK